MDVSNNPSSLSWEEEETENPVGRTGWVLNYLTQELNIHSTIKTEMERTLHGMDSKTALGRLHFRMMLHPSVIGHFTTIFTWDMFKSQSVGVIGHGAFSWSSFLLIKVLRSVVSSGGNPFTECYQLSVINVSENQKLVIGDGVLMDWEISIPKCFGYPLYGFIQGSINKEILNCLSLPLQLLISQQRVVVID